MNSETLLKHMPEYYYDSDYIRVLLDFISAEFNRYLDDCKNTQNELNICTASKTLDKYEDDFKMAHSNAEDSYRISNMLARLMGQGILTEQRLKDICQFYSNGTVDIVAYPKEFKLVISFTGTVGIPPNIADLKAIINALKNADWTIEYKYKYNTVGYLKQFTVGELAKYTVEELRTKELQHLSLLKYLTDENGNKLTDRENNKLITF